VIVVDANIVVGSVVDSDVSSKARRVASRDRAWILPPLWLYETTSSITTLVRAGALTAELARTALADARQLASDREVPVDQVDVLRVAIRFGISAYDAQYIALAEQYGVRCVTNDRELARRAPMLAVLMSEYLE
jgi:predicted nucleic acid-binding protein